MQRSKRRRAMARALFTVNFHGKDCLNHKPSTPVEKAWFITAFSIGMWGIKIMRNIIRLAALAATFASATPAFAQAVSASANAEARGVVLQPLTLTKEDDLDFGTVISTAALGTVVIDADDGSRAVTGGVLAVPSYPGGRALFTGNGTAGQDVNLTLNAPGLLVSTTNPLDTVTVNSMVLDSGNSLVRTIGATTIFQVGVGGDFAIAANQPNGLYTAQFDLTADYQ